MENQIMNKPLKIKILYFLFLFPTISLSAQSYNGIIKGRVFDAKSNKPVSFATVGIAGLAGGTSSDEEGNFVLSNLKPGFVELRVQSVAYKVYVASEVLVTNANAVYLEIPMEETSVEIESVEIKASSFRRDVESLVSLRRIDIREIEKSPGANRDISKVIQAFPGVSSTSAFRNDVIVRGGGSSENRFYLDGVEIPNLNHFATQGASGGPVGIINVDFVREVNFYSGAFPSDRGNALSSILDFKQIDPNKDRFKTRLTVGASDLGLALNGPVSDKTGVLLSARRSYLQFLFSALGLPFLPTYNDFQLKTRTRIDANNELLIIGLGAIDNSKLNMSADKTEKQRYLLGYLPNYRQWNYALGAVYKHYRDNGFDTWVISRNMLSNISTKYLNNIEISANKILDYNSWEAENKLRYEHNISFANNWKLNVGAGSEYARYHNRTYRVNVQGGSDNYLSNIDLFKYSVFGQISHVVDNERLSLSVGTRIDGTNYSSETSNPLKQFSPRFSASYKLTEQFSLNVNIGRYYELPPYTALGYRDSLGILVNKQNKVSYISVDHFVTGVDFLPNENSKLSVEGFLKVYTHYPFSVNDSVAIASKGADYGTFGDEALTATGKGRSYGVEFYYNNKNLFGSMVTLSYTLVRSEFQDINRHYVPSAWDNRHLVNLIVSRSFRGNWDFGFKWRLVGGAPYTPAKIDYAAMTVLASEWDAQGRTSPDYSQFNQKRLKAFNQLDIRIDKQYYFNRWSLMLYLDIQNILNQKADEAPIFVRNEENGSLKPAYGSPLRYDLHQLTPDSGTILPSIGIMIEF
jgi:hypothetical protein